MKVGQVDQQCLPNWNNYFNCSIFHEESPGTIHARKDSFGLHVILLDDMGTKVQWAQLGDFKPSFVVETSPKNFQAGIILEKPLDDIEMANRLLNAIIAKGLSDPGATGVARWARLPVGINGKPKYKSESGSISVSFGTVEPRTPLYGGRNCGWPEFIDAATVQCWRCFQNYDHTPSAKNQPGLSCIAFLSCRCD